MKADRRDLVNLALMAIQRAAREGGEIWPDVVVRELAKKHRGISAEALKAELLTLAADYGLTVVRGDQGHS